MHQSKIPPTYLKLLPIMVIIRTLKKQPVLFNKTIPTQIYLEKKKQSMQDSVHVSKTKQPHNKHQPPLVKLLSNLYIHHQHILKHPYKLLLVQSFASFISTFTLSDSFAYYSRKLQRRELNIFYTFSFFLHVKKVINSDFIKYNI